MNVPADVLESSLEHMPKNIGMTPEQRRLVREAMERAIIAERERCAAVVRNLRQNRGELLLHLGEMSAQEKRTAIAALALAETLVLRGTP